MSRWRTVKSAVNATLQNGSESWFAGILRFCALYVVKNKIGIPFHITKLLWHYKRHYLVADRARKLFVVAVYIIPCRRVHGLVSDSMMIAARNSLISTLFWGLIRLRDDTTLLEVRTCLSSLHKQLADSEYALCVWTHCYLTSTRWWSLPTWSRVDTLEHIYAKVFIKMMTIASRHGMHCYRRETTALWAGCFVTTSDNSAERCALRRLPVVEKIY